MGSVDHNGSDSGGDQGEAVEGEDTKGAVGVEISETVDGVVGLPETAGDEEAGESEEEDDAAPAELGEVAEEALGGPGGLEAAAVVEDEDEKDGEAAEAIEGGVAAGFGMLGLPATVEGPGDDSRAESLRVASEAIWLERSELRGLRQ